MPVSVTQLTRSLKNAFNPAYLQQQGKLLLGGKLDPSAYTRAMGWMGIILPNAFVAPIRYFVADETKEVRERLFYRDALAGGLGVVLYLAVNKFTTSTLQKLKPTLQKNPRTVVASLAGWVVNVAFQAVGAIKMSEAMSRYSEGKKQQNQTINININNTPQPTATINGASQVNSVQSLPPDIARMVRELPTRVQSSPRLTPQPLPVKHSYSQPPIQPTLQYTPPTPVRHFRNPNIIPPVPYTPYQRPYQPSFSAPFYPR